MTCPIIIFLYSIPIGTTDQFVDVTFDPVSKTVTCFFLKVQEGTRKFCKIVYGAMIDKQLLRCRKLVQQSSASLTDKVMIGFPVGDQNDAQKEYCFTVMASNGSFTVEVEGSIKNSVTGIKNYYTIIFLCLI